MFSKIALVAILACFLGCSFAVVEVIQDGNFILEYNMIENETLQVKATVRALGWVGVGLSESSDMNGADLILGGVKNGAEYCGDYFALRNSRPIEDVENNVLTYSASENATHTILTFTRLADTGDVYEDVPVDLANYIIWAYHNESDEASAYHGNINRGAIAL